jgi:hypothetical protein
VPPDLTLPPGGRFGGKAAIDEFTELRWDHDPDRAAPLSSVANLLARAQELEAVR